MSESDREDFASASAQREDISGAVKRLEVRFEKFDQEAGAFRKEMRDEMASLRTDVVKIQTLAKGAAWLIGAAVGIGFALNLFVNHGPVK